MGPPAPDKPGRRPPATGFRGAPGPGMLSPAARAGEREAAAGTPEGAGPAPAAPRALCPGLPSWETVQDSQDQKREQIRKELRGGARRYVSGEGGGGRTWLFRERGVWKAAEAREPGAFTPPPGRSRRCESRGSCTHLPTPLHVPNARAATASPADQAPHPPCTREWSRATQRGGRTLSSAAPARAPVAKSTGDGREVAREAPPGATAQGRRGRGGGGGGAGTRESPPAMAEDGGIRLQGRRCCPGLGSAGVTVTGASWGAGQRVHPPLSAPRPWIFLCIFLLLSASGRS